MKPFLWPRILTIASIGALGSLWLRHRDLETVNLGRAGYLAQQMTRFDRLSTPHDVWVIMIAGVFLATVIFGLYELLVFGASKLLSNVSHNDNSNDNPRD
jgi:hypothetical protein